MQPIIHATPLLGPSAVVIHTDTSCTIGEITARGAKVLSALVGPKGDAVLAHGEHWVPGIPLRVSLDPDEVGEAVAVTVERLSPDAADAFMDAVNDGVRRLGRKSEPEPEPEPVKAGDTAPSPSSDPGEVASAKLPSSPPASE